jgi:hypothetical protein
MFSFLIVGGVFSQFIVGKRMLKLSTTKAYNYLLLSYSINVKYEFLNLDSYKNMQSTHLKT